MHRAIMSMPTLSALTALAALQGTALAQGQGNGWWGLEVREQRTRSDFRIVAIAQAPDYSVPVSTSQGRAAANFRPIFSEDVFTLPGGCNNFISRGVPWLVNAVTAKPLFAVYDVQGQTGSGPIASVLVDPYHFQNVPSPNNLRPSEATMTTSNGNLFVHGQKNSYLYRDEARGACLDIPCLGGTAPEYKNAWLTRVESVGSSVWTTARLQEPTQQNRLNLTIYPGLQNRSTIGILDQCGCVFNTGLGDCVEKITLCMSVVFEGSSGQVQTHAYSGVLAVGPWGVDSITGVFQANQSAIGLEGMVSPSTPGQCETAADYDYWCDVDDELVRSIDFRDGGRPVDLSLDYPAFPVTKVTINWSFVLATVAPNTIPPVLAQLPSPWGDLPGLDQAAALLALDFDGDGVLEASDRWTILSLAAADPCASLIYDRNGDGVTDGRDFPCPLTSLAGCLPDIGSAGGAYGPDGLLNNNDYIVFIDMFFNSDPRADFGNSAGESCPDGVFDNGDFVAFIDLYFAGC